MRSSGQLSRVTSMISTSRLACPVASTWRTMSHTVESAPAATSGAGLPTISSAAMPLIATIAWLTRSTRSSRSKIARAIEATSNSCEMKASTARFSGPAAVRDPGRSA